MLLSSLISINGFLPAKYCVNIVWFCWSSFFVFLIISLDKVKDTVSLKHHKVQTFQKSAPQPHFSNPVLFLIAQRIFFPKLILSIYCHHKVHIQLLGSRAYTACMDFLMWFKALHVRCTQRPYLTWIWPCLS